LYHIFRLFIPPIDLQYQFESKKYNNIYQSLPYFVFVVQKQNFT